MKGRDAPCLGGDPLAAVTLGSPPEGPSSKDAGHLHAVWPGSWPWLPRVSQASNRLALISVRCGRPKVASPAMQGGRWPSD